MSKFVIYIPLEKYLQEWATFHFGNPVVLPSQSHGNSVIRTFITKLPPGATPTLNDGSLTAIAIPDSKAKPPHIYNHIGPSGCKAVKEVIRDLFLRSLWNEINPLEDSPVGLNTRIAAWCELHGIGIDRVETVRQCYYRMRNSYNKCGLNLKKSSRKKGGQDTTFS